jgi:regulatory protein YycI of two-component signal transduction system YycFG
VPRDEQYTLSVNLKAVDFLYVAQIHKDASQVIGPLWGLQEESLSLKRSEELAVRKEVAA